jgi:hypothetical protein
LLPIQRDQLLRELRDARSILTKWTKAIEQGIPAVDCPGNDEALDEFITQLAGELLLAAGRCETLSSVLAPR